MAPLLGRRVALFLVLLVGALALPVSAVADGRAILDDFRENGQIDGCYSRADFREALQLVRSDQRQYGASADVIQEAQVTNVADSGAPCRPAATTTPIEEGGGPGLGLWIGVALAVGVVAAGAGAWARRASEPDDEA